MAQTPPSEQTTRPAETAEPAGWPEEKTDSEEAGRDRAAASAAHYFNSVCGKILAAGKRVPLVGKFCELMEDAWQHIEELKGAVDDAKDVIEWAAAQETFFRAIVDTTYTDIKSLVLRPDDVSEGDDRVVRLWDLKLANNVGVEGAQSAVDAVRARVLSEVKLTVEVRDGKIVLAGTAPPSFEGWDKLDKTLRSLLIRPIDEALRSVAEHARDKMKEFKEFARDIVPVDSSNESFFQRLSEIGKAELFKTEFRDAEEAAMKAMSKLTKALTASTFFKLDGIERKLDVVEQKLDDGFDDVKKELQELKQTINLILRGQGISEAGFEDNLRNALPDNCEMASCDVQAEAGSATVGLHLENIAAATKLLDEVLKSGGLLANTGIQGVSVDRGRFLESYAEAVMRFTELTAHQKDKLAEVRDAVVSVLLAPAGSGKTFVAVQRMAEVLNSDRIAKVLFVARNTALALFACKWLVAASRKAAERIVERVHVLVDPFSEGPRRVSLMIDGARLRLALDPVLAGAEGYRLIVVDEAHHLAGEPKLHEQLKKVRAAEATLLFLSDGSQATKASLDAEEIARSLVELPQGREVAVARLSEVVRSTKRIVAGASAFQLEAGRKAEMSTHTLSPGPPLVARIFRLADEDEGERYAQEVVEAIFAVRHQLADLEDLNDCIAVVCPDGAFKKVLREPLKHALADRFELVDAATASSVLPRAETTVRRADAKAWLVLDSVDNMDGLERLVVICVGLDQVIDRGAGVLETRSRLYRALTRAQLAVAVVNEVLPGGWLEFLGHVELNADGGFDDAAEREKRADNAADDVVGMIVAETETTPVERPEQSARNDGDESEQGFSDNGSSDLDAVNQSDSDAVFLADEAPIIEEIRSAPRKVLQSIWDASAVATASRGDLRFMPFSEVLQSIWDASAVPMAWRGDLRFMPYPEAADLSKLALVRTLEGHSKTVRCDVHCTFVMMRLRRRSIVLQSLRTGGALFLGQTTTRSRCGTWRLADAWRR